MLRLNRKTISGKLTTFWMITRYADVREVLSSPHLSNRMDPNEAALNRPGVLPALDPPDHTRVRRMLTREFTVKRMNALRPRVEEIVDRFLGDMVAAGPPTDLMQAFALPVPSLVICELLGVPYEENAYFQQLSVRLLDPEVTGAANAENSRRLTSFMADLVARHRKTPGDDILSSLIREYGAEVSDDELIGMGTILLLAGHETTANTIGLGILLLSQHPEQLALVRDDPGVLRTAVEEILRYLSIVNTGVPKRVTKDIMVAGQLIPAGDLLMVSLPSANRDESVLPAANVFDVTRSPGAHVAFGHGIHQCLGQQLARMELAVALPALLKRLPNLRPAVAESELPFRSESAVNGLHQFPVTWG
ncbi:cytochrome P450 [Actinoplanes sp. NPDC049265]|uniref:cytochrome P450 n=1 Tax=Actinoplanes sp. NPDC049265 TaxID=3363902 RepID=UPI00371B9E3F